MTQHAFLTALLVVVLVVTVGSVALWVALDAATRDGARPWLWGLLAIPTYSVFPLTRYLLRRQHERTRPPGRWYVASRTVALGSLVSFLVAAVVSPPDPVTQVYYWLGAFPVAILVLVVLDRYWFGLDDGAAA
ncbi:hypothetical protein [Haloarcula amylovorans]|uniref:hypothetical protein n=1 Tax=Haloarcula amylovorans TaxID=2562280 RepID=UPI001075EC2A|nr:hypothetical protein [Halomicroarcula amylolytica]